jgi:RNA polymerase-binding transcription factor
MSAIDPAMRARLQARLGERAAQLRDEIAAVRHAPDAGEVEVAGMERDMAELREVEAALVRIASPRFGFCVDCGKALPVHRIEAEPHAARCVGCQERFEAGQAGGTRRD